MSVRLLLAFSLLPSLAFGKAANAISSGDCAGDASPLADVRSIVNRAFGPGETTIPSCEVFERLSQRGDVPGAMGVREVKFLMTGVDTGNPTLHFIDTKSFSYHYDFYSRGLHGTDSLEKFNFETYFRDARKNLAGTIIAHDGFVGPDGTKGLFTLEFWPTDPVPAKLVGLAFKHISDAMAGCAAGRTRFHPNGETQRALASANAAELDRLGVKRIATEDLFGGVTEGVLNPGKGCGTLRVYDGTGAPPTAKDVVIFKSIPNDISHLAGVITEGPQTPLSHVNLKAKQNDTPNVYVKDASSDPRFAGLIGKTVCIEGGPGGISARAATPQEAQEWFDKVRPKDPQVVGSDLRYKKIRPLSELGAEKANAFGAKAANVAELRKILDPDNVPDGFGVPFSMYDEFMRANGLYDAANEMMADPDFRNDPAVREKKLADFQRRIKRAKVPESLSKALGEVQERFPEGQPIRARSSTNNEDLEGFNGAGLYDSYTHRPDEGHLEETVKQVWASLWNFRAYEERDFYRIDHLSAKMGVLLTPNQDDELANGVAVTKNIYDPNWKGHYVNVQVGESLVTNPDPSATPDEFLVSAIGANGEWETQYIRHSTMTSAGKTVLTRSQIAELTTAMETIQSHFAKVYGKEDDPSFAMDIEFKIDHRGKLIVKQARPWVD